MTNLQEYKLSLFERCEAGDITKEERDLLLEAVSDEEIEDDAEISEYDESVLERFEAGLLTEEEAEMLLEATRYMKEFDKKYQDSSEKLQILRKLKRELGEEYQNGKITEKEFKKIKNHINDMYDGYLDKKIKYDNSLSRGRDTAKAIQKNKSKDIIQLYKDIAKATKANVKDELKIDSSPITEREPGHYKYDQMKRRLKSNKK